VLLGPPCEGSTRFVVEGLFQGGAGRLFALEVDEAEPAGRPYRGLLVDFVVDEDAVVPSGPLEEFDGFERFRASFAAGPPSGRTRRSSRRRSP
jgi:hypothetical protein